MKVLTYILLNLICLSSAFAQVDETPARRKGAAFFFRPQIKFMEGNKLARVWMMAQIGCELSEHTALGVAYCTPTAHRAEKGDRWWEHPATNKLTVAYAGIFASYSFLLDKHVEMTTQVLFGDGSLGHERPLRTISGDWIYEVRRDRFIVVEPTIGISTKLRRNMQMVIAVGRFETYRQSTHLPNYFGDLSSLTLATGMNLKFA